MLNKGSWITRQRLVATCAGIAAGILASTVHPIALDTKTPPITPADWSHISTPTTPFLSLVSRVVGNIDVNMDGYADLLVAEPGNQAKTYQVLVFNGGPNGLAASPGQIIPMGQGRIRGQATISAIGDTDGNRRKEVILRDFLPNDRNQIEGWIWECSPLGLVRVRPWQGKEDLFGWGDFNGDGFSDIISRRRNFNFPPGLCVTIHHSSKSGPNEGESWSACENQHSAHFGHDTANAGDVNGDGIDDLIIGSMKFSGRLQESGKAFLFHGTRYGLRKSPSWTSEYPLTPEQGIDGMKEQFFSWGIASAGDVNQDGFDDVLIGACYAEQQDVNEGIAFLYLGSPDGLPSKPDWIAQAENPNSLFGQSLAGIGDVNGDGFPDVAIGAPEARNGQQSEGAVVVYAGNKQGLSKDPIWIIEGDYTHEKQGSDVRPAGDINGDGLADLLMVNADHEQVIDNQVVKVGRCMVAYGRAENRIPQKGWFPGKRLLQDLQQRLDIQQARHGSIIYWGPGILAIVAIGSLSTWLQIRSRRRIAQLLEENRLLTMKEERTRLARDVHDHLGTDLNLLLLEIKQAAERLNTPDKPANVLNELTTGCERAINAMSELIWATDPAHDSVEAFVDYLSGYTRDYLEKAGIRCTLDFEPDLQSIKLQPSQRHHLYLAAKEAVHNAAKYSKATTVSISGKCSDKGFELAIQDDGIGFDPDLVSQKPNRSGAGPLRRGGNGLTNIRTRMAMAGGGATIVSAPNRGTTITFNVPATSPVKPHKP